MTNYYPQHAVLLPRMKYLGLHAPFTFYGYHQ